MSTTAPEANFKFWAIKIPKNSEKSLDLKNDNFVYHVSNATLGLGVNRGRTTVFCKANGEKAAICNLVCNTIENASLDLIVSRSMNASFIVKGPNEVTVSGYIQPLVEDSDSEMGAVEHKTVDEGVAPETKAPEEVTSDTKAPEKVPEKVASETKAPESQDKEKKAVPIEKVTESKKRKIEEVEQTKAENTQQKKRNKTKNKKNNQNIAATEEVDNKSAKSEDPPKTTNVEAKPKVLKDKSDQSLPRGDKTKKSYKKVGKGVRYRILKAGRVGVNPTVKGDKITLLYIGCLKDGTQFDKNLKEGLTFKVGKGEVIKGMEIGVIGMFPGEKRRIIIPSEQGYGKDGVSDGKIPPNSELHFTVQRK